MNRLPRRNPTSVSPISRASRTASPDGAETDATTGTPPHDGLLNNLEPPVPAHQEHVLRERQASFEQRPAHNFVYGVVSAHVFALCYQFAARVEQTRGVQ